MTAVITRKRLLRAADLFCGGGGTTTGAEQSGRVKVVVAVNHWPTAIETHQHNHPHVQHVCLPIDSINPRHDRSIPDFDLLLASPECTHHSIARGGAPVEDQKRATPWHVCVWAEAKRPRALCIENVREFRDWGPLRQKRDKTTGKPLRKPDGGPWMEPDPKHKGETFRAWIHSLESLGYVLDHQLLNAADYGAATKRVRLFITAIRSDVYRRRRHREIPWPDPTHAGHWTPAYEIIDFGKPCPSIFGRKRALADKTLRRIEIGLRRFVAETAKPFVVLLRNNSDVATIGEPLSTITTAGAHHALAVPFQFKAIGRNPGLTRGINETVPTIVAARANHAMVVPFISQYHNGPDGARRNCGVDTPVPTLDTQNRYGMVTPFLATITHGGRLASAEEPLATITTAHRGEHSVVTPFIVPRQGHFDCHRDKPAKSVEGPLNTITASHGPGHLAVPFVTKYYGTGVPQAIDGPLGTVTTRERFGLVAGILGPNVFVPDLFPEDKQPAMQSLVRTMRELGVYDVGFRMLDDDELARATGFPEDYVFFGTKEDRVKQIGNAVPPAFARALCQTLAEAV